jgi:hypothetical protein
MGKSIPKKWREVPRGEVEEAVTINRDNRGTLKLRAILSRRIMPAVLITKEVTRSRAVAVDSTREKINMENPHNRKSTTLRQLKPSPPEAEATSPLTDSRTPLSRSMINLVPNSSKREHPGRAVPDRKRAAPRMSKRSLCMAQL